MNNNYPFDDKAFLDIQLTDYGQYSFIKKTP